MNNYIKSDIAIIGAGVIGCAIARRLSRYKNPVVVLEKEADIGWGTTKANSGIIHAGYAGEPESLKLRLSPRGNKLFRKNARELDIPIKEPGSLVNANDRSQIAELEKLYTQGLNNGVPNMRLIRGNKKIREMEPNIKKEVCASILAKDACIVSPYETVIALYENSKANGIDFLFNNNVIKIENNSKFLIHTDQAIIKAEYIVNAAGLFTDNIAAMIGDTGFKIEAVKGQYFLIDKEEDYIKHINFPLATGKDKRSKGILMTPTIDGNILIGPNYIQSDKDDLSTEDRNYREITDKIGKYFDNIPFDKVITSFSGLRAVSDTNDFIISPSPVNTKFINAAGIQSPGLTCVFAISEMVVDMLKESGLRLKNNKEFNPLRYGIKRFDQDDPIKNNVLFKENRDYANIVCRCEKVTEAEVVEAVRRGAATLDGIKFRTRAGMGRCQGGYCALRILKILSRELNIPIEEITKKEMAHI
jgi:glycerol-3-phosphate dehydrogenase